MEKRWRGSFVAVFVAIVAVGISWAFQNNSVADQTSVASPPVASVEGAGEEPAATTAVVYRSKSCGCCGQYVSYLESNGFDVETRWDDRGDRSERFGVPAALSSCHTVVIGDYVVEGHVPVEAIQKLLTEQPELIGIALPSMPIGSPGMPGAKTAPFEIKGFTADGSVTDFMSI